MCETRSGKVADYLSRCILGTEQMAHRAFRVCEVLMGASVRNTIQILAMTLLEFDSRNPLKRTCGKSGKAQSREFVLRLLILTSAISPSSTPPNAASILQATISTMAHFAITSINLVP